MGVNGAAVIECKVEPNRDLNECTVISETAPDFGFGAAALRMAQDKVIRAPGLANGASRSSDAAFRFTVPFAMPWVTDYQIGGARWDAGDLHGAIEAYTAAIRLAPGYRDALVDRGAVYDALGQYGPALDDENNALRFVPYTYAYTDRGLIYLHTGKLHAAANDFDAAIKLDASNTQAYLGRAAMNFQAGDYDRAIEDFDHVTAADPHSEPAFQSRCLARAISGKALDLALADCGEALALQPQNAKVLELRGMVQYRLGRFEQAIADSSASLTLRPRVARPLYVRSLAERRLGRITDADADLGAATALDANIAKAAELAP